MVEEGKIHGEGGRGKGNKNLYLLFVGILSSFIHTVRTIPPRREEKLCSWADGERKYWGFIKLDPQIIEACDLTWRIRIRPKSNSYCGKNCEARLSAPNSSKTWLQTNFSHLSDKLSRVWIIDAIVTVVVGRGGKKKKKKS